MSHDSVDKRAARRLGTTLREKYRLERVLGVGGMAAVYLATHRNGNRVAVKMLHPEVSADDDLRARFIREGYTGNAIDHPGVVRVLDDDVAEDGAAFLVMELLEGETLHSRRVLSGGKLPAHEVVALGHQLLDVLAVAHDLGIVHRDIKPDNLFLTNAGVLKMLDFGIARAAITSGATPTQTGRAMGTPAFMPPEQALGRGKEVDARADIWAVGATLFTLISGRLVHDGETPEEQLVLTATEPAPLLADVCADVPLTIADVIDRALRFQRDDRWPSARAMNEALAIAHTAIYGRSISKVVISTRARIESAPTLDVSIPPQPPARDRAREHSIMETPTAIAPPLPITLGTGSTLGPTQSSSKPQRDDSGPGSTLGSNGVVGPPGFGPRARSIALAVGLLAAASAIGILALRTSPKTSPGASASSAPASTPTECTANAECVSSHESAPFRCNHGACKPLLADGCRVFAEPADITNDATVWVGAMYHDRGGDPLGEQRSVRAVDVARRDFAEISGGLPAVRAGAPKRPLAVVACEDGDDPTRVARHLVDDVGVPAILGFSTSQEVIDLATTIFAERGVAAFASNQASMLSTLPHAPDKPRMVWRVTPSAAAFATAMSAIVRDVWEPELRAPRSGVPKSEPLRVLLTTINNTTGLSYADTIVSKLQFNGKSAAENGTDFRVIREKDGDPQSLAASIDEIIAFRPHIVIVTGNRTIPTNIEARWPKSSAVRPRYVEIGTISDPTTAALVQRSPEVRHRVLGVDTPVRTQALAKFVLRYNDRYTPKISPYHVISAPYDAFYLLAYAIASIGDGAIDGASISRAISRFRPPGVSLDVGPSGIFTAFDALSRGQNVDLIGTTTSLDFDLETGDAAVNFAGFCLRESAKGQLPETVQSTLVWRAESSSFVGDHPCP